jgi:hypothetical protein
MKSGIIGSLKDPYNRYPYWVLPGIVMGETQSRPGWSGSWADPDYTLRESQTDQIRAYLSEACEGHWTISNHRFLFELESDWEMFKTMCLIGWQ